MISLVAIAERLNAIAYYLAQESTRAGARRQLESERAQIVRILCRG